MGETYVRFIVAAAWLLRLHDNDDMPVLANVGGQATWTVVRRTVRLLALLTQRYRAPVPS